MTSIKHKQPVNRVSRTFQRSLLASACVMAMAAPGAFAQTSSYAFTAATPGAATVIGSNYMITSTNNQFNSGTPISSALLNDDFVTISIGGVGSSFTMINNATTAAAAPNTVSNNGSGSLALLQNFALKDGITIQSSQVRGNITPVATTASMTGSDTSVTLVNQGPGNVVVGSNSIAASTQLNQATSTLSGAVPVGYSSATSGSSTVAYSGASGSATATGSGSVSIGNSQVSLNAGPISGSSASVSSSNVALSITDSPVNWNTPLTVTSNAISATYGANDAANTIAAAGGSASVDAAATVANLQINREAGGAVPPTASVTGSGVTAAIRDTTGGITTLTSTLDVSGNAVSAGATGNNAINTLSFGALTSVAGVGSVPANSASANASNNMAVGVSADLVVSNAQTNQDTGLVSTLTSNAVTANADLTSPTGAITVNGNTLSAAANGNRATSSIATSASAANFTASAAAASVQTNATNSNPSLSASNSGATAGIRVGFTNNTVAGTLTANGNELSATATGNQAETSVSIAADNIALTAPAAPGATAAAGLAAPQAAAAGGASATNVQVNIGAGAITSSLTGAAVSVDLVDQTNAAANAAGATIGVDGNRLLSSAVGSTGTTGVDLSGTNVSGTGAVSNAQSANNTLSAVASGSGVSMSGLGVTGSTVTVSGNTVAAAGTAMSANNALTVAGTNVTPGAPALAGVAATTSTATPSAGSAAAFSVSSAQNSTGSVSASNIAGPDGFAQIYLGSSVSLLSANNLSVNENTAEARAISAQIANTLDIEAVNVVGATLGKIGAVSNVQSSGAVASSATLTGGGTLPSIGISYEGSVSGGSYTVSGNQAEALSLGNTATNALRVTASNLVSTSGAVTGAITSGGGTGTAIAPFALVNAQLDQSTGRSTSVSGTSVGIQNRSIAVDGVNGVSMTVADNTVAAESRKNNAGNTIDLNGFPNLTAGASALNQQSGTGPVSATVIDANVRAQATDTTTSGTHTAVTGNAIGSLALGNSGSTMTTASASNQMASSGAIAVATAGSSVNATTGAIVTNADFGVVNAQAMSGNVTATTQGSIHGAFTGSDIGAGSVTVSGNAVTALAQANSGVAGVELSAPNMATSAAVASYQSGTGAVSSTLMATPSENATAGIRAGTSDGAPLAVTGNVVRASAGQNQSVTVLDADAVVLAGRSFSNQFTGYASPTATTSADFSTTNVQNGVGSVSAAANPGTVGMRVDAISSTSAVVTNNAISALASVNTTSNALNLAGSAALNATGAINNVQNATAGSGVTATMLGAPTYIGVTQSLGAGLALNDATVTVSGNRLNGVASGNEATNALQATSNGLIAGPGAVGVPTFALLNSQSNAAAVTASVSTGAIGMQTTTGGNSIGSNLSVLNNSVLAAGQGNTASNNLVSSAIGNGNSASMLVANTQFNTASIVASVSSMNIGVSTGAITGSTSVVSGNSISAQAIGNSAVNRITAK